MKQQGRIACPKCGHELSETPAKFDSEDNFVSAVCSNCGATITEADIRKQALKVVEGLMGDIKRRLK